jgi:hypothetical protein
LSIPELNGFQRSHFGPTLQEGTIEFIFAKRSAARAQHSSRAKLGFAVVVSRLCNPFIS